MTMNTKDQGIKIGEIISKAWSDEAFKQRLLDDATTVLTEEGIAIQKGMTVKAVENTDTIFHLVIPPKMPTAQLDISQLASIAGGGCCYPETPGCTARPGHKDGEFVC
jgi:hypothetical protein